MDAGEAGCILDGVDAGRIGDAGVQSERPELVEGVDDAFAVVVEVQAKTGSNRSLFVGRVSDSQARCEIGLLLSPEPGSVICGPTGSELQKRFVYFSMERGCVPLLVPCIGIDGGRDLLPILLVGSLEDGVAEAKGDGQVRPRSPGILDIPFKFICLEMPIDEGPIGIKAPRRTALGDVVVGNGG